MIMKKLILLLIGCAIVQGTVKAVDPEIVLATMAGDADRVETLLLAGVGPDSHDGTGQTALQSAASRGDQRIVRLLIRYGADVNLDLGCWTPLRWAIQNGHLEIIRILIAAGADVNHEASSGAIPLFFSTYYNRLDIFKTLIAAGANVNRRSADNIPDGPWTPMRYATLFKCQEFIDVINRVNAASAFAKNQILVLACAGHPRLGAALPSLQSIFHGNSEAARITAPFVCQAALEVALYGHNQ